jgi:hypothetical protein
MAEPTDDPKAKLKALRDRLAIEAPRAQARPQAPPDLVRRLKSALELVSRVYLLTAAQTPALDEVREDALVEGLLVVSEWERWLTQEKQDKQQKPVARPWSSPIDQRRHERLETNVTVKLLRHSLSDDTTGGVSLESATTSRPARNVSLGGIFVAIPKDELPQVTTGSIVHVSVSAALGAPVSFEVRAAVARREATGLGLRWVDDSERFKRAIESLLDAVRRAKPAH